MKYLIFTSRWISILICLLFAFILLMTTIAVVFFKQQQGVEISDGSLATISYMPFLIMVAFFATISILFAEDDEFGGEFLSLLSAGISNLFLLYVIIHALGSDLLQIIARHDFSTLDKSIPVLEGLADACPWWLLITAMVGFSLIEELHTRLGNFGKVGFFIYAPYLILKIYNLF